MPDEFGIHSPIAIELFFERENDQCLVHVLAKKLYATLSPCPELRTDIIDHRNTAFLHLAGDTPVESWRVNDDCQVRLAPVSFVDQPVKEAPDLVEMSEDFG